MNIYTKILLTILPLTLLNFAVAVGITYYFSSIAILEHAETWMVSRLVEARRLAEDQARILHLYGLDNIPASVAKAKTDTGTAIAQIEVGESGFIFAIDEKGIIALHPDDTQLGRDVSSSELYQQIKRNERLLNYSVKGEKNLAVFDRFPEWGWIFIVADPEREVFQVLTGMKPYLFSFALAGCVLVVIILMVVARRITEPLRLLASGVEKISSGDLTIRIPVYSSDELGRLSLGFNEMTQQLYNSHNELEQRVEERTRELTRVNADLCQTIEEKNSAVTALQINERRIEAILKASPIGIGLVVNRKMGWANDAMYALVGYDKDTLLNKESIILYSSKDEFERVGRLLYDKISHQEIDKVETQWVTREGAIIDCSIRATPLDPNDLSKGLIVAVADITAAKTMEAKLQRAKKMEAIGTLAGGVAHDLNNILSGIVSYPELLLLELEEGSPLRKPLETIQKSGERAATIVQDLLTMARRGVAVTEIVNLNEIVRDQLDGPESLQIQGNYPEIEIIEDIDPDLLNLRGSKAHLAKSIMNLIANAAEATDGGGCIRVSTRNVVIENDYRGYEIIKKGRYVVLTVDDDGIGIAEADLERIFEPFYTRKQMGRSGTGLGMAVVWGTVKDHHGFIDVHSIENKGSTFRLFFPATDEDVPKSREPDSLDLYRGSGEHILIVDDSGLQREIAEKILSKLNYETATAASGEEAVFYVKTHEVDLLVLDMIMPNGMDGLETYQKIAEYTPGQRVIIASGFSETDRVKEIEQLSGGHYLKKPYTIEKLGKAVRRVLLEGDDSER